VALAAKMKPYGRAVRPLVRPDHMEDAFAVAVLVEVDVAVLEEVGHAVDFDTEDGSHVLLAGSHADHRSLRQLQTEGCVDEDVGEKALHVYFVVARPFL